jgi:hypothetical protein
MTPKERDAAKLKFCAEEISEQLHTSFSERIEDKFTQSGQFNFNKVPQ